MEQNKSSSKDSTSNGHLNTSLSTEPRPSHLRGHSWTRNVDSTVSEITRGVQPRRRHPQTARPSKATSYSQARIASVPYSALPLSSNKLGSHQHHPAQLASRRRLGANGPGIAMKARDDPGPGPELQSPWRPRRGSQVLASETSPSRRPFQPDDKSREYQHPPPPPAARSSPQRPGLLVRASLHEATVYVVHVQNSG
ncbi:hypothetical protein BP6252_00332 [Coleophoma cylindrospora]|uniref:Uncharacterized protein n=1 Tax=Coleophoma cylindrospora TaxID=1849047 RepID=A0A3D8SPQ5_9HELO|nr:hypothetical protein BP6252_00332 [Coleophoma cylindrospora]